MEQEALKKGGYLGRLEEAERRREEQERIRMMEREELRKWEMTQEMKRQEAKMQSEQMLVEKSRHFYEVQMEKERKMMSLKERQALESAELSNFEKLKRFDRAENVQRINKVKEYQRGKILEKIENDSQHYENIKREKAELMNKRNEIKKQIELSKQSINEQFEKVRKGQIDPKSLSFNQFSASIELQ